MTCKLKHRRVMQSERNNNDEEGYMHMTKEYASYLLRNNPACPKDFVAIAIVKADPSAVQNARQTLKMDKRMAALFVALFFPLALPLAVLKREMSQISRKLTAGAEDDIYVLGAGGFATINKGVIKAWTPAYTMCMEEDTEIFNSESSSLWGTSAKAQSVLIVNDDREDHPPQLCFVNKKDLHLLMSRSRKYCGDLFPQ